MNAATLTNYARVRPIASIAAFMCIVLLAVYLFTSSPPVTAGHGSSSIPKWGVVPLVGSQNQRGTGINECYPVPAVPAGSPVPVSDVDRCMRKPTEISDYMRAFEVIMTGLPRDGSYPGGFYEEDKREEGNEFPPHGLTMIGKTRLRHLGANIDEVNRNKIPGAIVEAGVWRGGAMLYAAAKLREDKVKRPLYLFDVFKRIDAYKTVQMDDFDKLLGVELGDVQSSFAAFGYLDDNVHFVKGFFADTTPQWTHRSDPIAILRIDGNFYESYQDIMYAMFDNVSVGGIVVFDDINCHDNVQLFWDHFKEDHNLVENMVAVSGCQSWFRKKHGLKIDQSKKRNEKQAGVRFNTDK